MWVCSEEMATSTPGSDPLQICWCLDLVFLASRCMKNKFLLFIYNPVYSSLNGLKQVHQDYNEEERVGSTFNVIKDFIF